MVVQKDEETLRFRRATTADIPILLELEKSVWGSKIYFSVPGENSWDEELKNNIVYLIEKDGIVLGNISYEEKSESHIYISDLIVSPCFRGQGIARATLVKFLKGVSGAKRIDLVTHPDNKPALNLYQSLGFIVESRKENYYGDGEPRLALVLQK